MIKFPSDLKISMAASNEAEALENISGVCENHEWFNSLHAKLEGDANEATEFTWAIEGIQRLIKGVGCLSLNQYQEKDELLHFAHSIPRMAMSRLKEEFSRMLSENSQHTEYWSLESTQSSSGISLMVLNGSVDDETLMETQVKDNTRGLEDYIDLVNPNIIPGLKCIAEVMFASGYDAECCQAYVSLRKDALDECLVFLGVERLTIDDVLQMDWSSLESKINKWVRAARTFIRVYLASEKCLADKVFRVPGSVGQDCFIEASKNSVLLLLSLGEAVAIRCHPPTRIFGTLYLYEAFADLLPDIDALFSDGIHSYIGSVAHEVLSRLGESVRRSLIEFENAVRTHESSTPFTGGGVHHLTKYVMNSLGALTDYSDILNFLLKEGGDDRLPPSCNVDTALKDESEWSSSSSASPMAQCLQSMVSILESNLKCKSQLYTNASLQQLFLMNNFFYMVEKVKGSELQPLMGENWITRQIEKSRQHAENYESTSWSPVLSFLRDEGIHIPPSFSISKAILKARFLCFNLSFEVIYRTQRAWSIPDVELRDDLRISIALKLLQEYRTFLGTYYSHLASEMDNNEYIKYRVEDFQGFLFNLFAGSPRSLNKSPDLKEDLHRILIGTMQQLEPEHLPFQSESTDDDISSLDLIASVHDGHSEGTKLRPQRNKTRGFEVCIVDLVHPNVILDLNSIMELMVASGYETECLQTYINIRKYAMENCLLVLDVENLRINDVLQMDWSSLNSNIKKWVRAVKIFIQVYLASEKSLAGKVFGISGSVSETCFIEASKNSILQLLTFGEAVAIRNHSPEKILLLLCMCDRFLDLLPVIDVLFSDEAGAYVRNEAHGVLSGLGESVIRTLDQFRNAVKTNESSTKFTEGGIHHLTRYVMKYLKALSYYSDILNFILNVGGDDHVPSSLHVNTIIEVDCKCSSSFRVSPVSQWLQSTVSILESNLKRKSLVYTNVSYQHVFLLSNLRYVTQKVDSELQDLLGENWVSKHYGKIQQVIFDYERTSWSLVRSFLRHEGLWNPRSGSVSKTIIKERFQGFNHSFEEIYNTQTAWFIHNEQLRKELRTSFSSKVLLEYRLFLERFSSYLKDEKYRDRYIKYNVEDLQKFLLDLFEGSSKSMHKSQRR